MTVTPKSARREISDLQRLLLSVGLMKFTDTTQSGKWGAETQAAVVALYGELGWDHAESGKWVTAPALAALSGLYAARKIEGRLVAVERTLIAGGGGSMAGGGGSMAGGGGSMAGGGGSMAGGGGSMAGGGGSMAGGGGSMAGGGGSMAGGGGSMAGGGGSHSG